MLQGERSYKILMALANERHPQLLPSLSSQTGHQHSETERIQGLENAEAKQNDTLFTPLYQATHVSTIRNLPSATYTCSCLLSVEII